MNNRNPYSVVITNGTNFYYQNKNGLYKKPYKPYSIPISLFRVGKKLLPRRDVALVKIHNPNAFFRKISQSYVKNRSFVSRSNWNAGSHFLVFDPKNYRNVINYYKIKSKLPHGTLTSRNNQTMKTAKLRFGTPASTIRRKWKKFKFFKNIVGNRRAARAA